MVNNKLIKISLALFLIFALVCCSSQPKKNKGGDIYNLRSRAEGLLESGNREASRGNYSGSLSILNEGRRNAVLTDDPSLLIRSGLSLANVLFALGRTDEAFSEWEKAIEEARKNGNRELLAVCRIYHARGSLLSDRASASSVLDEVNSEMVYIKTDNLYVAFSWQVKGLALRLIGSYHEAETAVRNSLVIHEKEMYLENASYDWYVIASIRSLSGNAAGALAALETAIEIDRRVENSWGLAADWRAVGDVRRILGREPDALEAYARARAIYEAIGNASEVLEIDRRMGLKETQ